MVLPPPSSLKDTSKFRVLLDDVLNVLKASPSLAGESTDLKQGKTGEKDEKVSALKRQLIDLHDWYSPRWCWWEKILYQLTICSILSKHQTMYGQFGSAGAATACGLCMILCQWTSIEKNVMVKSLVVDLAIVSSSRISDACLYAIHFAKVLGMPAPVAQLPCPLIPLQAFVPPQMVEHREPVRPRQGLIIQRKLAVWLQWINKVVSELPAWCSGGIMFFFKSHCTSQNSGQTSTSTFLLDNI